MILPAPCQCQAQLSMTASPTPKAPRRALLPPHAQDMHIHLANSADFSSVPATVCATVAHKRRVTTEHDVQNHPQAPQVTPLVIERGLLHEDFHHFGCHVFCRATLRNQIQASFQREGHIKTRLRFITFHSVHQVAWCKSRNQASVTTEVPVFL